MSKQNNNTDGNAGKAATTAKEKKQPKEIRQSVTQNVHRSEIALNPYNPKRHTDRQVKQQVANIKANGYLGGIVWNRTTGNLVDGHRRVQALDIINKYDGTQATDYTLKVEVVEFDRKTELEQLTYMAIGNSKADYNLVALYADQIDAKAVGLSDDDYEQLQSLIVSASDIAPIQDFGGDFLTSPQQPTMQTGQQPTHTLGGSEQTFDEIAEQRAAQPHASKEEIQAKKNNNTETSDRRNAENAAYVMLQFDNPDRLADFCDAMGYRSTSSMIIDGEEFLQRLGI